MEGCDLLDLNWELGVWGDSFGNNDNFDFPSSLDQLLTSRLEDVSNNDAKSGVFENWMDEIVDLSIMREESRSSFLDDLAVTIEDPTAFLSTVMDTPSEVLESRLEILNFKSDGNDSLTKEVSASSEFVAIPDSPGGRVPDNSSALSPEHHQESFYKSISSENPFALVKDESKEIDHLKGFLKEVEVSCPDSVLSPNFNVTQFSPSTSVSSIETLDSIDSTDACDSIQAPSSSPGTDSSYIRNNISTDLKQTGVVLEVTVSKVTRTTKSKSQNHKKLTSGRSSVVGECRRDRKRKQNKDAATRYRQKKRKESVAIKTEESILEDRNQELKTQVQQLSNEIGYLKGLLKEAQARMQSTDIRSNSGLQK